MKQRGREGDLSCKQGAISSWKGHTLTYCRRDSISTLVHFVLWMRIPMVAGAWLCWEAISVLREHSQPCWFSSDFSAMKETDNTLLTSSAHVLGPVTQDLLSTYTHFPCCLAGILNLLYSLGGLWVPEVLLDGLCYLLFFTHSQVLESQVTSAGLSFITLNLWRKILASSTLWVLPTWRGYQLGAPPLLSWEPYLPKISFVYK